MPQILSEGHNKTLPVIRRAEIKDAEAIAYIAATTFSATFGHSMPAVDLEAYLSETLVPSAIKKELSSPLKYFYVACSGDDPSQVMGFVQMTQGSSEPCIENTENPVELQRMYVDEKYHGSGVGGALFRHVEKWAKEKGFQTMWLGVWDENFIAQKAYARFGFSKVGEHDFVMGECVQTDWILMKSLRE